VTPGDPADKAGLKTGDVVIAVNGERITLSSDLVKATSRNAGHPIDVTILRDGQEKHIEVTPVKRGDRGMIGIMTGEPMKSFQPGPLEAVKMSFQRTVEGSGLIFKTIGQLVSGEASPRQLMGP